MSEAGALRDLPRLREISRVFVRHGLSRLRASPCPGVQALLRSAGLEGKAQLSSTDIGFGLAPRLNAAGESG